MSVVKALSKRMKYERRWCSKPKEVTPRQSLLTKYQLLLVASAEDSADAFVGIFSILRGITFRVIIGVMRFVTPTTATLSPRPSSAGTLRVRRRHQYSRILLSPKSRVLPCAHGPTSISSCNLLNPPSVSLHWTGFSPA
jgi:hypothetical protein